MATDTTALESAPTDRGLSYYLLMGSAVGLYAAWFTLALNVFGAILLGLEPLKLLRVYATFFMGAEADLEAARSACALPVPLR